eukprot:2167317-Rhodomonas_salina.2
MSAPDRCLRVDRAGARAPCLRATVLGQQPRGGDDDGPLPVLPPPLQSQHLASTAPGLPTRCPLLAACWYQGQVDAVLLMGGNVRGGTDYPLGSFFSLEALEAEVKGDETVGVVPMPGTKPV